MSEEKKDEKSEAERAALLKRAAANLVDELMAKIKADPEVVEVLEKIGEPVVRQLFELFAPPVITVIEGVTRTARDSVVDVVEYVAKGTGDEKYVLFADVIRQTIREVDAECGFVQMLADGVPAEFRTAVQP